ncbi:MAG: hypothetical protein ACLGHY_05380, partial [Gammaproteobacteria bacterium]
IAIARSRGDAPADRDGERKTWAAQVESPQLADMPALPGRRQAMQLMAASLALAGGACTQVPRDRIYPYVNMPEAGTSGLPIYYASAFVRDGYAHGVLVGTREGRPIKIEGNALHPASLGATDPFAQASVLQLWDPDRSASVAQRLGGAPEGQSDPAAPPAPLASSDWSAFDSAWRQRDPRLRADGGARLRVLTGSFTSPSLQAQLARLFDRYPRARWHRHDPLRDDAADDGARLAFGQPVQPVRHFARAGFVLALDADPFSQGPASVRQAMDWSSRRAAARDDPSPATLPQLVAVETTPGLFGARADERLALPPSRIEALTWGIASRLFADIASPATPADAAAAAVETRWAEQLRRHARESLVIAGPNLSPATHALVHLLNQRLGAYGHTVDGIAPPDSPQALGSPGSLAELTQAMTDGTVDTLLILGGNPAYDAPADLPFAAALTRLPFSAHLSLYRDETSQRCAWHLPETHVYEQWSDALAFDGSAALIQPAIAPLYDTRSVHQLLAMILGEDERNDHAMLRAQWRAGRPAGDFDGFWSKSLRSGVVAGSAPAPSSLPAV